jgi:hypothetical protein
VTDTVTVTAEPFVGHVVLDAPAEHPTLGFEQIATALATIVLTSEPRFAVGIFGGWGSGKSTLMDEIERRVVGDDRALAVRFNAWRYEREPHLIVPLLDTIRARLSEQAASPRHRGAEGERMRGIARRIGRVVRALARATSVEVGITGIGSVSLDAGQAIDELSPPSGDPATSAQSLYFAAFEELAGAFAEVERASLSRIVVFVDDLDRCLPTSALTMLESMKLFFDMPGFVFVVGLDERAVEAAVRTKFTTLPVRADRDELNRQIEREYLKKIFQVPYTLPAMAPGQLGDLLLWLDRYGRLGDLQRCDLRDRVRRYLRYVATEGRINPREIKRYLNAYTIRRMVRPDLDPDTVLALQTIDFRGDWDQIYEDVVLAEPDVFVEVLGRFRDGDGHAFENLWPQVGVLPLELSEFLRSAEAAALAQTKDIERYLSFIETTRSSQAWVRDAMRDVGTLRQHVRDVPPTLRFASPAARELAEHVKDVLGRLAGYHQQVSGRFGQALEAPLAKLHHLLTILAPSTVEEARATTTEELELWRRDVRAQIDGLQQELRLIRRSSAFAPG